MSNRKCTVSIFGGAIFDYVYAVSGDLNSTQQNAVSNNLPCPIWDTNTQFRIDFLSNLVAGNASFGNEPPTEFNIYRVDTSDNSFELAATLPGTKRGFTDYAVKNGKTYKYLITPSDVSKIGSPIETSSVPFNIQSWELLVVDETDDANIYTLSAIYKFEYNVEDVSLQNNTSVNKLRGFTPHLKIQKDSINCWTGTLSALAGVYDCSTHRYLENMTTLDAIKALSTDIRTKFLRDFDGHLYKIDVSSAIEMSQRVMPNNRVTTKKLEWTEVGTSSGAQIIGYGDLDE